MRAAGKKRSLLREIPFPTVMVVKKFLKNGGIRVVQRDLRGKLHLLMRGDGVCIALFV